MQQGLTFGQTDGYLSIAHEPELPQERNKRANWLKYIVVFQDVLYEPGILTHVEHRSDRPVHFSGLKLRAMGGPITVDLDFFRGHFPEPLFSREHHMAGPFGPEADQSHSGRIDGDGILADEDEI